MINPVTAIGWREQTEDQGSFSFLADNGQLHWLACLDTLATRGAVEATEAMLSTALNGFALNVALAGACCTEIRCPASEPAVNVCRCIWVSGLPGCGVLDVGAPLAKALGGSLVDTASVFGVGGNASDPLPDGAVVDQALSLLLPVLRSHSSAAACVIVCDCRCAPGEVLMWFDKQDKAQIGCEVTHVLSVLDPLVAYPWSTARHPVLLSRSSRGLVNGIVVQQSSASRGVRQSLTDKLVGELLSTGRVRAQVLMSPTTTSLLEGPLQEPSASPVIREMMLPPGVDACCPQAVVFGVFAPLDALCDIDKLQQLANDSLAAAVQDECRDPGPKALSSWNGLFCVEARFRGEHGEGLWVLSAAELQHKLEVAVGQEEHSLVTSPHGDLRQPQHWSPPLSEKYGAIFWFCLPKASSKSSDALRVVAARAAELCLLRPPPPMPFWTAADIPAEDMMHLEQAAFDAGLPDGYFFDGSQYIDVDGNTSKEHPSLGQHIAALVESHNNEVQAKNTVLDAARASPTFAISMAVAGGAST